MTDTSHDNGLLLKGLDGSNPASFLASLGTLRTLCAALPDRKISMGWTKHMGAWRPKLCSQGKISPDQVVQVLHENAPGPDDFFPSELLASSRKARENWDGALKFPCDAYRSFCQTTAAQGVPDDRTRVDAAAAFCADGCVEIDHKISRAQRTPFDFTAGQQSLLNMMATVVSQTDEAAIHRTLFKGPDYDATAMSLRWDPLNEKRQYALQAIDPTKTGRNENPILADRGTNRLAMVGVLMLPLIPTGNRAAPPGFTDDRNRPYWAWPIWEPSISRDVASGLLSVFAREHRSPNGRQLLRDRGVIQVYRSWITQPSGRYRCFTPAEAI